MLKTKLLTDLKKVKRNGEAICVIDFTLVGLWDFSDQLLWGFWVLWSFMGFFRQIAFFRFKSVAVAAGVLVHHGIGQMITLKSHGPTSMGLCRNPGNEVMLAFVAVDAVVFPHRHSVSK
ncbi:MAG: hypothetical protein PVJ84_19050 [Desulfobacteraceae bacterium]